MNRCESLGRLVGGRDEIFLSEKFFFEVVGRSIGEEQCKVMRGACWVSERKFLELEIGGG